MNGEARPFRVNPDQLREGWFLFLSDSARLAFFYLQGLIRKDGDRNGRIAKFDMAVFCHESRIPAEAVQELLDAEPCPIKRDGISLYDSKWGTAQASESKERVRRHREKKAVVTLLVVEGDQKEGDVTLRAVTNANVTARNVTDRYNPSSPLEGPPSPQHSPSPPISPQHPDTPLASQGPQGGKKNTLARMVKPTKEELAAYFREEGGAGEDARAFWDHYEANGWKVGGKTAMKDWKAAVRNWLRTKAQREAERMGRGGMNGALRDVGRSTMEAIYGTTR